MLTQIFACLLLTTTLSECGVPPERSIRVVKRSPMDDDEPLWYYPDREDNIKTDDTPRNIQNPDVSDEEVEYEDDPGRRTFGYHHGLSGKFALKKQFGIQGGMSMNAQYESELQKYKEMQKSYELELSKLQQENSHLKNSFQQESTVVQPVVEYQPVISKYHLGQMDDTTSHKTQFSSEFKAKFCSS